MSRGPGDLVAMAELLWPPPLEARIAERGARPATTPAARREFLVLPSARRPRILVPAGSRAAAARAVGRLGADLPFVRRSARQALQHALALGLAQPLVRGRLVVTGSPHDGLDAHLSEVLGRPVQVSLQVGPLRANRKPVLHVMDARGTTLAYAKVGWNDLTRRLVVSEAQTLTSLAGRPSPTVASPDVLHAGRWHDLEVLVLTPLDHQGSRRRRDAVPLTAMLELAQAGGTTTGSVTESQWWRDWMAWWDRADLDLGLPADVPPRLLAGHDIETAWGCWHGDWAPWNMAVRGDELALWDWERFRTGVPVGFDVVHFCAQIALRSKPPHEAFDLAGRRATSLLTRAGLQPRAAETVVRLYLLEILRRYGDDAQLETGRRLGRLLTGIAAAVGARLPHTSTAGPAGISTRGGSRG